MDFFGLDFRARVLRSNSRRLDIHTFRTNLLADFPMRKETPAQSNHRSRVPSPALTSHVVLNRLPDPFHNLPIPPSTCCSHSNVMFVDLGSQYSSAPPFHSLWRLIPSPSNIYSQGMSEKLTRLLPLVALELPDLSSGEDCNNS